MTDPGDAQLYNKSFYKPGLLTLKSRKSLDREYGFTIIELLVVIVILGILSSIALPSFMGHISKAKETEAKIVINALKKSQQGFYLENNQFTSEIKQLNFPNAKIQAYNETDKSIETENYNYSVMGHPRLDGMFHVAFAKKKGMKSYGSVVHLRDGRLEECGLFSLDISRGHAGFEILGFALDAVENYERYCS